MLVFSRKAGEAIVLPNSGVTIGVVAVKGGQVRLGITAPTEVSVRRGEIGRHSLRDCLVLDRSCVCLGVPCFPMPLSRSLGRSASRRPSPS